MMDSKVDMVNNPPHYNKGEIEQLTWIRDVLSNATHLDAYEGYLVGNIQKYLGHRLGEKTGLTVDLDKAMFYGNELREYRKSKGRD